MGVKYHKFRNGVNRPCRSKLPDIHGMTLLKGTLMFFNVILELIVESICCSNGKGFVDIAIIVLSNGKEKVI